MATRRPYIFIGGTDTYVSTSITTVGQTAIASLPTPLASGTSDASWLKLYVLKCEKRCDFPDAELRTGNVYANVKLNGIDWEIELLPMSYNGQNTNYPSDSAYDSLCAILNYQYQFIEQGTYFKQLHDANYCLAVQRGGSPDTDRSNGMLKVTMTLKQREATV